MPISAGFKPLILDFEQHRYLHLTAPLYFRSDHALRFELGPATVSAYLDPEAGTLNPRYFDMAFQRAKRLFEAAFDPDEEWTLVYQIFSRGRQRIANNNLILRQLKQTSARVKYTRPGELLGAEDYREHRSRRVHWQRMLVTHLKVQDIEIDEILWPLIYQDFGVRPRLRGECFFVNPQRQLVMHLYDDRGLDLVAEDPAVLEKFAVNHREWLLSSGD